jgi:hypothetical protein
MGDIPGVEWTSPGVDRRRLRRHYAVPEVQVYEFEGKRQESLWWEAPGGGTSASPASEWARVEEEQSPDGILRRLYEALELPGEVADYHFAIQSAAGALWARRRDDPDLILKVEELCWLDIKLVEAYPQAVSYEGEDGEAYYTITAFHTLISLYEREGFLEDALAVVDRAGRFGDLQGQRERLEAKVAAVAAEAHR